MEAKAPWNRNRIFVISHSNRGYMDQFYDASKFRDNMSVCNLNRHLVKTT